MKIHTDRLTHADLTQAAREAGLTDVYVDASGCGSRSRHHAFNVRLTADQAKGRRHTNSGQWGAGHEWAATWDEHGEWMAVLFDRDPAAIITHYNGRDDFHRQTGHKYGRKAVA